MEEALKSAAVKAPIPTIAAAFLYFVICEVIKAPIDTLILSLILIISFFFSLTILYLSYKKDNKKSNTVSVNNNLVQDVKSEGGDVVVGNKSPSRKTDSDTTVSTNSISRVNTGGGDFILGKKVENNDVK